MDSLTKKLGQALEDVIYRYCYDKLEYTELLEEYREAMKDEEPKKL